ncbi:hypothetical protein DFH07DRAFT_948170 [Mycena maculata]|uniref:NmrA-like domain-containing protein n=1 Tax=Mycena maculata TaxID=230809 RepID=A0AAD7KGG0_9AGAR|nr:hypothetical protein DFH07DRAFT_948170 [Mycena maculata]
MSSYKSFAIVGAGAVGLPIIGALAAQNVRVILLSRPESTSKVVPSGVQVAKVDYSNASAVAEVFKQHNVDVVLSTITTMAVTAQRSLVDAAKLGSIKLFVPSEFGMPTEGHKEGILGEKDRFAESLKAAGIPYVRFYTGMFAENLARLIGYSTHGKITIVGKGEVPLSITSIGDIAGFVAHVLTTLSPSELENHVFRLEGDRKSLNELGLLFKTTVEHVDQIAGERGGVQTHIMKLIDTGAASTGWDQVNKAEGLGTNAAGSANAFWQGHQWKTLKDVHNL